MESTSRLSSRTSRLSRIAQPVKRSLYPEKRSMSSDGFRRESHIGRGKPSMGMTAMTPTQTPMSSRMTNNHLMTSERKMAPPTEDKRLLQGYITRITDCVKHIRELGKDFVNKGGLKSMSAKEFLVIINHIMKQINPKANFSNNYSDELYQYLMQLDYPYSVNKSWFKTPNAPHSFNHIVIMLDFLLDYLPLDEEAEVDHEFNGIDFTLQCSDFPSLEFTHEFNGKALIGYHLWNNGEDDEFGVLKNKIADDLIRRSSNYKNLNEITERIDELAREYETLAINRIEKPSDRELNKLKQELAKKQQEHAKLTEKVRTTEVKNAKLVKELAVLEKDLKEKQTEEKRLKAILTRQNKEKLRDKFESVAQEHDKLRTQIRAKQSFVDRLKQVHYTKMLNHTKLVDKKSDLHGTLMLKLIELREMEEARGALDVHDLDRFETRQQLEEFKQQLANFMETVIQNRRAQMESLKKQIADNKDFKLSYQEGQKQALQERVDAAREQYKRVQTAIMAMKLKNEREIGELQDKLRLVDGRIKELQSIHSHRKAKVAEITAEKERVKLKAKTEIRSVLEEREKNLYSFKEAVQELNETIRRLHNV